MDWTGRTENGLCELTWRVRDLGLGTWYFFLLCLVFSHGCGCACACSRCVVCFMVCVLLQERLIMQAINLTWVVWLHKCVRRCWFDVWAIQNVRQSWRKCPNQDIQLFLCLTFWEVPKLASNAVLRCSFERLPFLSSLFWVLWLSELKHDMRLCLRSDLTCIVLGLAIVDELECMCICVFRWQKNYCWQQTIVKELDCRKWHNKQNISRIENQDLP